VQRAANFRDSWREKNDGESVVNAKNLVTYVTN